MVFISPVLWLIGWKACELKICHRAVTFCQWLACISNPYSCQFMPHGSVFHKLSCSMLCEEVSSRKVIWCPWKKKILESMGTKPWKTYSCCSKTKGKHCFWKMLLKIWSESRTNVLMTRAWLCCSLWTSRHLEFAISFRQSFQVLLSLSQ